MSGSYLGGSTVITVRRGPKDMARRQAHWKRKIERQQREHDAAREAERQMQPSAIILSDWPKTHESRRTNACA